MTSAKEQFGLTDKPEIHGVVERENDSLVAGNDYSAQIDAELKKKPEPVAKAKNGKIAAYKIAVSGNVRKGETMESYSVSVTIPQCPDDELQYHIQNFVEMELVKQGKLHDGVLTRAIDEIEETELTLDFIGKDVFSLSKEQLVLAQDYYGIAGCHYTNPSLRALQKLFYMKYKIKTDESLHEEMAKKEFISIIESTVDYKKLPKLVLK
jgi:hypothetical protein